MTSKFSLRLPKKLPPAVAKWLPLGAVFVIGGGVIATLNFSQHAPKSLSPAGTQLVPQQALATVTLTTDELTWTKLRQFGTPDTQQQLDEVLASWKARLFTDNGYSFKRDIKPWIGDRVTLAMLPGKSTTNPSGGGWAAAAQDLVLVVPIAEPLKAKSLLADRLADGPKASDVSVSQRSYKGVEVQTLKTPDNEAIESAVIGTKWLLLSNTTAGIEQAIDTHKGDRSLLDSAGYRKAATRIESPQPPGKNFAQVYLNIPAATQALAPPTGPSAPENTSSILPLQGSDGLVATALIESEGIRFQGTSWLAPKNDLAYGELRNEASEMPRRLPDDTLIMMSGSNLQQFWQGFSEGNTSPPFFPNPQNLKAGLLTQTGLDLDEDVMPWAAGEFALGLLPPAKGNDDSASEAAGDAAGGAAGGSDDDETANAEEAAGIAPETQETEPAIDSAPLMIMVQTNDRSTAESVWGQLDDVMASRYRFTVETDTFEGGSLTRWISPFQGVQFSHGWLPGNVTFFAVGDSAAEAVAPSPPRTLAETRTFQTLTSQAPQPNNGHFYIDLTQINALEGGVFPLPQLADEGPTRAIQAVGLTTTVDSRAMDYDLYVKLARGSKPKPL
ncbi:MAG: DUF3352 domain-containing protein [Cyanobacteria bacterium J06649_5]